MYRQRSAIVAIVVTLVALAISARSSVAAPERTPTLVFEAHVGARTAELGALLDMLADALETHGFAARPDAIRKILGGRAPQPGVLDAGKTAADIAQSVTTGFHAYVTGNFDTAVTTLTASLEVIERNPGLLVTDTKNTDIVMRAYMALALSQSRLGRTADGVATMTELIRITRGQPISRADFGPEADKLYRTVLRQVQAAGRGSLTITTGDDRALIFVDGSLRGMGKTTLGDLIVGRYRVFVQVPGTTGRRYSIDVVAEQDHYLAVKAPLEEALWITDTWVGFRFSSDAERKDEARFASELVRGWTGDGMVTVIGASELQGKPAVIATLYRTDGTVVRSASVEIEGADVDRLRSLARFVADGTPGDDLDILTSPRALPSPSQQAREGSTPSPWPKLVVLGGIAMVGAGITLYAIDEDPDPTGTQQPQYRDTAPAGVVLGAIGVALTGVGAWLWTRGSRDGEVRGPAISIGRTTASVGWTTTF